MKPTILPSSSIDDAVENSTGFLHRFKRSMAARTIGLVAASALTYGLLGCPTVEPVDDDDTTYQDDDDDTTDPVNYDPEGAVEANYEPPIAPADGYFDITITDDDTPFEDLDLVKLDLYMDGSGEPFYTIDLTGTEVGETAPASHEEEKATGEVEGYTDGKTTHITVGYNDLGDGDVEAILTIKDLAGYEPSTAKEVFVIAPNGIPELEDPASVGTLEFMVGHENAEERIYFTDPNNGEDSHEVVVTGLPNWISEYGIDNDNNFVWIKGTAPDNAWEEGNYNVDVLLTDLKGASDQKNYTLAGVEAGTARVNATFIPPTSGPDADPLYGADIFADLDCTGDLQSVNISDSSGTVEVPLNATQGCELRVYDLNGAFTMFTKEVEIAEGSVTDISAQVLNNYTLDQTVQSCTGANTFYDLVLAKHADMPDGFFQRYEAGPLSTPITYFVSDQHENGTTLTQQEYDDLVDAAVDGASRINDNPYGIDYLVEDLVSGIMTVREGSMTFSANSGSGYLFTSALITIAGYSGRTMGEEYGNMLMVDDNPACSEFLIGGAAEELHDAEHDLLYVFHMSELQDMMNYNTP